MNSSHTTTLRRQRSLTPAIGKFLQPGKTPKTEAFFQRVQPDAAAATDAAKATRS